MPLRMLITAGPTREYIDPVRYLSNDSSGQMGFALAEAALRRGHRVTLVHGPVALRLARAPAGRVRVVAVTSAAEMDRACRAAWPGCDVLIMAAAVADYAPHRPSRRKLKKTRESLTLQLRPTVDILAALAAGRRPDQIAIGFALETHAGRTAAQRKLTRKCLDAIVLNSPAAIGTTHSQVEVLTRVAPLSLHAPQSPGGTNRPPGDRSNLPGNRKVESRWTRLPAQSKSRTATALIRLAESLRQTLRDLKSTGSQHERGTPRQLRRP